jgi:hypothetical protein
MDTRQTPDTYPFGLSQREWHVALAILAASLLLMAGLIAAFWRPAQIGEAQIGDRP